MNQERINQFLTYAKDESFKKFPGYTYIGKGQDPCLKVRLNVDGVSGDNENGKLSNNCIGSVGSTNYYLSNEEWNKIFNPKESIDSRVELAKTFIGKEILSVADRARYGKVVKFTICFSRSDYSYVGNFGEKMFIEHLAKHGSVVVLIGTWNDGGGMFRPIDSQSIPELWVEVVRINNYVAEDKGSYYAFGCAEIGKSVLRRAKELLSEPSDKISNRKVESITIGAGVFTLDILNKLNL